MDPDSENARLVVCAAGAERAPRKTLEHVGSGKCRSLRSHGPRLARAGQSDEVAWPDLCTLRPQKLPNLWFMIRYPNMATMLHIYIYIYTSNIPQWAYGHGWRPDWEANFRAPGLKS